MRIVRGNCPGGNYFGGNSPGGNYPEGIVLEPENTDQKNFEYRRFLRSVTFEEYFMLMFERFI